MLNRIIVIDDFIDKNYQEQIKNPLMGEETFNDFDFPWFYNDDVTEAFQEGNQGRPCLSHVYLEYGEDEESYVNSEFHDFFMPLLNRAAFRLQQREALPLQGRSFLQFPLNLEYKDLDTPHLDIDDRDDYYIVLYYVCDSDGDTVIFNETVESERYTVKQRVSPKQGRVVIFDGSLMHTAQQPKNNVRCVVNYNLEYGRY